MRTRFFAISILLLTVLACSPFSGLNRDDEGSESRGDSVVSTEPTATIALADEAATPSDSATESQQLDPNSVQFISTDMCQGMTGARSGESGVARGGVLHRMTLVGENVVCNDGTPAVMYVKRAENPANENVWVFHLQGGGGCQDYGVCLARWCGTENYDAGKMSSQWAPPRMQGRGLFLPEEVNPWSDVNQVFVYYCSSDGWTGQASDVIFTDPADPDNQYRMHTRGHTIIEAVIDSLWSGAASDSGEMVMPPLSAASEVVLTGTSAGSGGVTHHLDWLAGQFDLTITRVVGVIDAGSRPLPEDLEPNLGAQVEEFTRARTGYIADINAFLDQTCVSLTSQEEAWRCGLGTWVQHNHITTPFFVRMDLGDSLMIRDFVGLGGERQEVATAARVRLAQLPMIGSTAVEADEIDFVPGVYGPACGQHVGLTSGPWYLQTTVADASGKAWTFSEAIQAWYEGSEILAVDTVPPATSECGETNDDRD